MNFRSLSHSVSVKTKTIVLVLIVIVILSAIFFLIRYNDIKSVANSNQLSELKRVTVVYQETLKRIRKFYITRGYANINSYGIREAFERSDATALHNLSLPRWKVITKENRFLTSFCFYDRGGNLLTYFGQKPQEKLSYFDTVKKPYDGFWYTGELFRYHTVSEVRDKNHAIVGYVVFVIDPRYFLKQIRKIMDIDAYIYYEKSPKPLLFSIDNDSPMVRVISQDNFAKLKEVPLNGHAFVPYTIAGKGLGENNDFKIIFLQDITHWKEIVDKAILQSIIVMVLLILITMLVMNYGFDIILRQLDELNAKLMHSQSELQEINEDLQKRVQREIELKLKKEREANEKERILVHQSKLASMGEMIGNIAHQWRQPLTELSSILINMEMFFDRGKLTKERLQTRIEDADMQIKFMSRTIDDFRNFFSSGKQKESLPVSVPFGKVEKLMRAALKNNGIAFTLEIQDDFVLFVYPNEITQALLNLVSNAKDILVERSVEVGAISLKAYCEKDRNIIEVRDNAGGIEAEPIEKIFEPYFSTKHATSGTGIGLYMTKIIIEKNNAGMIVVHNDEEGAVFQIIFPNKE